MVAAVAAGSALVGAGASIYGSSKAAGAQTSAANQGTATQLGMFQAAQGALNPFTLAGQGGVTQAQYLTGTGLGGGPMDAPLTQFYPAFNPITSPYPQYQEFKPTMDQLAATPGYQFTLQQGLKGAQNATTAQGLGVSGAAQRAGADYAAGLASNTYNQQLQNHLAQYVPVAQGYQNQVSNNMNQYNAGFNANAQNQTNSFNKLLGLATLGENAGAQTGAQGTATGNAISQNLQYIGNAQGQAYNAAASGINSGLGGVTGAYWMSQQPGYGQTQNYNNSAANYNNGGNQAGGLSS